jgi:hypothetical protein
MVIALKKLKLWVETSYSELFDVLEALFQCVLVARLKFGRVVRPDSALSSSSRAMPLPQWHMEVSLLTE